MLGNIPNIVKLDEILWNDEHISLVFPYMAHTSLFKYHHNVLRLLDPRIRKREVKKIVG